MAKTRQELRADFFRELLSPAAIPLPGDRVEVVGKPTNKQHLVGSVGIVHSRYRDFTVEIDGEYQHFTANSLRVLTEDEEPDQEGGEVVRNVPITFARFTQENLEYIRSTFDRCGPSAPVHVVTQVVNSLLGMLVLLQTHYKIPHKPEQDQTPLLQDLVDQGWPEWVICDESPMGPTATLGALVRHIRNAAAHGLITYSSNSRYREQVTITVEDRPSASKPVNWRASIRGDQLDEFCTRFTKWVGWTFG